MNLSDKEQTFLVRGLDKATTSDEADTCAKNFFKELRSRGIDGYRFIDQMDYAEYEREIDEESVKSNQAWDGDFRARAAQEKANWVKSQKVNSSNAGSVSGCGGVPPQRPAQMQTAGQPRPNTTQTDRSGAAPMPAGKILFLLILSLAFAFLCFRRLYGPSLIFGLLLAFPMIGSRLFRWVLGLIGLVIAVFFAYVFLYELNYHPKDQAEVAPSMRASEQAIASEQLQVQVAPTAGPEQRTASWATPTPSPMATPEPVRQDAESLATGHSQPIESPMPRAELVTPTPPPKAELIKLPAPKRS